MFGGIEMVRGNLTEQDQQKVRKIIEQLINAVSITFPKYKLTRGQIPLLRPINFVAVLTAIDLHLIMDNVPVGGMPDHTYIDRRDIKNPIPLDALIGECVRDLGYRQPSGMTFPNGALSENENTAQDAIKLFAEKICNQLAEEVKMEYLNIPYGFQNLRRFVPAFLHDHPDPKKNVFLMMRFKKGEHYDTIEKTIRKKFQDYGLMVMRADDKDYTGDLWENVCLYMFGCKYGVSVFEEIDEREFNPSVALELGFMVAHDKRCLLLKDQRMPKMPTDIVGKLYKPFDTYNIENSISEAIDSWVKDIGLNPP